ncbi:MAG: HEAT repeat domain-containing protein, partial [Holophagales bacterium]|nr:HEAT repeat domain-containing protein [Holophagales bacterium]
LMFQLPLALAGILPALAGLAAKAAVVFLAAFLITLLLRRAPASIRHQVWVGGVLAVLALPALGLLLPAWQVDWLDLHRLAAFGTTSQLPEAGGTVAASPLELPARPPVVTEALPSAARVEAEASARTGVRRESADRAEGARTAADSRVAWPLWLALVWLAGTLFLLGRLAFTSLGAWWVVRRSTPVTDPAWSDEARRAQGELGLTGRVSLVETARLTMPMAFGLFGRTVLLPESARGWDGERRRVVLLHEMAHLARRDCQTLFLARLTRALHWPDPLAWIATRRLRSEREQACDDLVLEAGADGPDYAQHLLELARSMRPSAAPAWATAAMARPSELEGRLLAILDPERGRRRMPRWIGGLAVAASAVLVFPLASLQPAALAAGPSGGPSEEGAASASAGAGVSEARLVRAFEDVLRDGEADLRAEAAQALGRMHAESALPALESALLEDGDAGVREQAAWALGMIESEAAVDALTSVLASEVPSGVREQAAWALGMIESPAAAATLGEAVRSDASDGVREQAAWALGMIEDASEAAALASAVRSDASAGVREQAAWALGMIEDASAVDALTSAVRS